MLARLLPYLLMFAGALVSDSLDPRSPVADSVNSVLGLALVFILLLFLASEFGTVLPILAVTWRRLHDANLPGPWALLSFIPLLGQVVLLVLVLMPSTPAGRRFDYQAWGPAPGIPPQGYPTQAFQQPPQ
ncbi:DUF805 domain-containing protein [Leucobacter insecticola]|nr:DUF805 domain-containing protein [Leucobacter insecticola]